jgi:hypothetical protein
MVVKTTAFDKLNGGMERWVAEGGGTRFVLITENGNNTATITIDDRSFRLYGTGMPAFNV